MKKTKNKGFTIIELMATLAIIGIFSALIFSLFKSSTSMLVMAENDDILQNESRVIIDILEEEFKYASMINSTINKVNYKKGKDEYIFEIIDGELKRYKKGDIPGNGSITKNIEELSVSKINGSKGVYEIYLKLKLGIKNEYEYKTRIKSLNIN